MRRRWQVAVFALAGAALCFTAPLLRHLRGRPSRANGDALPLAHTDPAPPHPQAPAADSPPLAGLDLLHLTTDPEGRFEMAQAQAGTARLTLDPELQRKAVALMAAHHLPEAAAVVMETATGRLLVYASHTERGPERDLCSEATAPSASVFKIVTAAALVEDAHLGADTQQCYAGGEQRIAAVDLIDDPRRDRSCTSLAGAMGRSINTVFARLASERLTPSELEAMAVRFGFGQSFAFDVPVQSSSVRVPTEPLEFARTAAGFWNSTLSPLQAAEISAIVARGGETVRPRIVDSIVSGDGAVVWSAPAPQPSRRAIARPTADQIAAMMSRTVSEGTCQRAFHDGRGRAFLARVSVAGKTGTLTDAQAHRFYTWFTGFAPTGDEPAVLPVAVAVLVINGPAWQVKANVVARDILRAYFAGHDVAGVTQPTISATAHAHTGITSRSSTKTSPSGSEAQ